MFSHTTHYVIDLIRSFGYLGIFLGMTLESLLVPVPSEVIIPFAAYLASLGVLNLFGVMLTGTLGNVTGSLIIYYIGIQGGRPVLEKYGRYVYVSDKHIAAVDNWFRRRGEITILLAKVLPGIRGVISLPAGISRMSLDRFIVFSTAGILLWVSMLALFGFSLGRKRSVVYKLVHLNSFIHPFISILTGIVIAAILLVVILVASRRVIKTLKRNN